MSTKQLTPGELQQIHDEILPAFKHYNQTGSMRGIKAPKLSIIQALHTSAFGYKFDQGCPACLGDAMRMLANVYREQADEQPHEQPVTIQEPQTQETTTPTPAPEPEPTGDDEITAILQEHDRLLQAARTKTEIKHTFDITLGRLLSVGLTTGPGITYEQETEWIDAMAAQRQQAEARLELAEHYQDGTPELLKSRNPEAEKGGDQ
jgi:hypothetical protein